MRFSNVRSSACCCIALLALLSVATQIRADAVGNAARSTVATVSSIQAGAATQPVTHTADIPPNPYLSATDESHMDAEYDAALSAVETSLAECPPRLNVSSERRDALTMLDILFHDPFAPARAPIQAFHLRRAQLIADGLEHDPRPTKGAAIYMFYNMGFIVRTPTVTLGFDLIRAEHLGTFALPDDLMKRIIDQCDVLFISHAHLDHADPWVAQLFIDQGKLAVGPPDLWSDQPINAHLTKLQRDSTKHQTVKLKGVKQQLTVITNPGFQNLKTGESVACNVYVIKTPDGQLFAHTGDNNAYVPSGMNWTEPEHPDQQIDVLMLNDWTMTLAPKTMRGYNPRLVIAGHFDELGHDNVNARAPYWRGLIHGTKSIYPWLVMTWGESFDYQRDAMPAGSTTQHVK